jgi:regulator of sigma E protease
VLQQLDGEPIHAGPGAWQEKLRARAGSAIIVGVERAGAVVTLSGTMPEGTDDEPPMLGFVMAPQFVSIHQDPFQAVAQSLDTVWRTLKGLVMRRVKAKGLVGPVGIIGAITYSLRVSFTWFVWFAAFISLNLAIINLLPIPVVDGGHIVFGLIEAMREKTMAIVTNVFAVLIIAFFLYVTFNDVRRLLPAREQPEEAPAGEEVAPDSETGVAPEPEGPATE